MNYFFLLEEELEFTQMTYLGSMYHLYPTKSHMDPMGMWNFHRQFSQISQVKVGVKSFQESIFFGHLESDFKYDFSLMLQWDPSAVVVLEWVLGT